MLIVITADFTAGAVIARSSAIESNSTVEVVFTTESARGVVSAIDPVISITASSSSGSAAGEVLSTTED